MFISSGKEGTNYLEGKQNNKKSGLRGGRGGCSQQHRCVAGCDQAVTTQPSRTAGDKSVMSVDTEVGR